MIDVIDRPVMSYEPTAKLIRDQDGNPIVSIQLYADEPGGPFPTDPDVYRFYLEPIEAKRLALNLLGVSQEGISREIAIAKARRET